MVHLIRLLLLSIVFLPCDLIQQNSTFSLQEFRWKECYLFFQKIKATYLFKIKKTKNMHANLPITMGYNQEESI